MRSVVRSFVLGVALFCSAVFSPSGLAQEAPEQYKSPAAAEMALDLVLLRPLLLGATVVGSGLFVAALPFTLPSGSTGDAARELVAVPFHSTFLRCLGCTRVDLARREEQRRQQQQQQQE